MVNPRTKQLPRPIFSNYRTAADASWAQSCGGAGQNSMDRTKTTKLVRNSLALGRNAGFPLGFCVSWVERSSSFSTAKVALHCQVN